MPRGNLKGSTITSPEILFKIKLFCHNPQSLFTILQSPPHQNPSPKSFPMNKKFFIHIQTILLHVSQCVVSLFVSHKSAFIHAKITNTNERTFLFFWLSIIYADGRDELRVRKIASKSIFILSPGETLRR